MTETFPLYPCHVCNNRINKPDDGLVLLQDFTNDLGRLVKMYGSEENVVKSEAGSFVNAVTVQYFSQFNSVFCPKYKGAVKVGDSVSDIIIDMNAHAYRLKKVLDAAKARCKEKVCFNGYLHLCLLSHKNCLPKWLGKEYEIPLTEINNPAKALEWTIHLSEKAWWNPYGWVQTLEHLFGRNPT